MKKLIDVGVNRKAIYLTTLNAAIDRALQTLAAQPTGTRNNLGIDGTVASGKGTLAHFFVENAEYRHLSAGIFYRLVAKFLLELREKKRIDIFDETSQDFTEVQIAELIAPLISNLHLGVEMKSEGDKVSIERYFFEHYLLGQYLYPEYLLRDTAVNALVPKVANTNQVISLVDSCMRKITLKQQRVVVDGRDWYARNEGLAIVVYLCVSDQVGATRRMNERLKRVVGSSSVVTKSEIYQEELTKLMNRNKTDQERANGRLLSPQEAIEDGRYNLVIDTTNLHEREIALLVLLELLSCLGLSHQFEIVIKEIFTHLSKAILYQRQLPV